jgi:hypothetical protein
MQMLNVFWRRRTASLRPALSFRRGFLDKDTKSTCDAHCAFSATIG